jgi:hypothetical protein
MNAAVFAFFRGYYDGSRVGMQNDRKSRERLTESAIKKMPVPFYLEFGSEEGARDSTWE